MDVTLTDLKVSPFLLINLDKSLDRLQKCEALLQQHHIDYLRISAVNGDELSPLVLQQWMAANFSKYYKTLTANEIACYLSHRKCWQYLLDSDFSYAVVLEDDFSLEKEVSNLHQYIQAIKHPWDCIKLMEWPIKRNVIWRQACVDKELVRYDKIPSRTGAYVVSRAGAVKMLAQSHKIARPVDIDCQYWWENNLMVFGLKPYIFAANPDSASTIDAIQSRRNSRKSVVKQFTQKVKFILNNRKYTRILMNKKP